MKHEKALLAAILFFLYRIMATYVIKKYALDFGMEIIPGTWGCSLFLLIWLLRVKLRISDTLSRWFRNSSIIMFLIHPYMIDVASIVTDNSTALFIFVVLLSIAFSGIVMMLSQKKKFSWLKHLW